MGCSSIEGDRGLPANEGKVNTKRHQKVNRGQPNGPGSTSVLWEQLIERKKEDGEM